METKQTKQPISLEKVESLVKDKALAEFKKSHDLSEIDLESGATARQMANAIEEVAKAERGLQRAQSYIEQYSKPVPAHKERSQKMADFHVQTNQIRMKRHQIKLQQALNLLKGKESASDLDKKYDELTWQLRVADLEFIKNFPDHAHAQRKMESLESWEEKRQEEGRDDLPCFDIDTTDLTPLENKTAPRK